MTKSISPTPIDGPHSKSNVDHIDVELGWRQTEYQPLPKAAAIAGISIASLYRAETQDKLSFVRLAGRTLVTTQSLARFVSSAEPWVRSDRGKEARATRSERARAAWRD